MTRSEFIIKYKGDVIYATRNNKLFPSVYMAQAILESNNGNSNLAKNYNNFFGIKVGSSWSGETITYETLEYMSGYPVMVVEKFRVYNNESESFEDRIKLLEGDIYKPVMQADTADMQAEELQNCGYATDPEYANKLKSIINTNDLVSLDKIKSDMKNIELISAILIIIVAILSIYKYFKLS